MSDRPSHSRARRGAAHRGEHVNLPERWSRAPKCTCEIQSVVTNKLQAGRWAGRRALQWQLTCFIVRDAKPSGVELQVRRRQSRATTMFFPQSSAMLIRESRISSEG